MLITASLQCVLKYAEQLVVHRQRWTSLPMQHSPYDQSDDEASEDTDQEREGEEQDDEDEEGEERQNLGRRQRCFSAQLEQHVEEGDQIDQKYSQNQSDSDPPPSGIGSNSSRSARLFVHHHRASASSPFLESSDKNNKRKRGNNIRSNISSFFGFKKHKVVGHNKNDIETQDNFQVMHIDNSEEDEEDDEDDHEKVDFFYNNIFLKYFHEQNKVKAKLPRSVIISSMYLGGSGAFLAIAPLCMWDFTMSASFAASLLFISIIDAKKIDTEFKPDIDTAGAIRKLKWMRWSFHFCALVSVFLILWLDTREEIEYYALPIIESVETSLYPIVQFAPVETTPPPPNTSMFNDSTHALEPATFHENSVPFKNQGTLVLEGHTGLAFKWPLIILSASSPIFLRAGGGGVSTFYYSLPPSQTLETGLPVSTILAILVLCWHNPNEQIVRDVESMIDIKTALPMFLICPLCVAAALAFVLYGFKRRSSGIISVVLLLIMCVRQQISNKHKLQSKLDWASLLNTIHALFLVCVYLWYKNSVQIPMQQRRTGPRKPFLVPSHPSNQKKIKQQHPHSSSPSCSPPHSDPNFLIEDAGDEVGANHKDKSTSSP